MSKGKMMAVIGGQYGSEGKGTVVAHIAHEYDVHVRVGSPNAGHTFYLNGEKHVMQSIPCGWINPAAKIVIGRGALINMKMLIKEISHIKEYYPDFLNRLFIDPKAGVLDECFHEQEGGVEGEAHRRIGSTGEGVGPARVARINRDPSKFRMFEDVAKEYGLESTLVNDTPRLLATWQDEGMNILLEGTQGSGLSLLHSFWPYCTSIDTNAAQILAECGIAPSRLTDTMLVVRTFPIRVAGNSGPMHQEMTWYEVSNYAGYNVGEERTTVTKKVRRIGMWDKSLFHDSITLNRPTSIALMFANYIDGNLRGVTDIDVIMNSRKLRAFMKDTGIDKFPVHYINTAPDVVVETQLLHKVRMIEAMDNKTWEG